MTDKPKLTTRIQEDRIIVEVGDPPKWVMDMSAQEALIFSANLHLLAEEIIEKGNTS